MSEERSPKEISGLLQLACAVHFMDPRTRHLLLDAARLLDDYAALLARHNALREAVAWERECIRQLDYVGKFWDDDNVPGRELIMILDAARAEVDRLIANKGAADCEGEG